MRKILLLFILIGNGFIIKAQPEADPGFDSALSEKLQWSLQVAGSSGRYKNLSVAIYLPGQGHWVSTYNPASLPPISTDSRFCVASNSKSFVAGLCLRLMEEGLLDLDQPIGAYLSQQFRHVDPGITIRQLLSHQSGLSDFYNDASAATLAAYNNYPDSIWTPENILSTLRPPLFAPGQSYGYSNTNYLIAQMVCSEVTCLPVGQLLQEKVFRPLGLSKTVYPGDDLKVFDAPFANLYNNSNNLVLDTSEANAFLTFIQTAGGIWSTASDMVKWYQYGLFNHSPADTFWLSKSSQSDLTNIEPWSGYGLGIRARNGEFGGSFYYHAGAWGYRSYTLYDTETGIIISVLSNKYGYSVADIADQLYKTAVQQLPVKSSDIAVVGVIEPKGSFCDQEGIVRLQIQNTGLTPVETLAIQTVAGDFVGTITQDIPVNLPAGAIQEITLQDAWWVPEGMDLNLSISVVDHAGYPFNNTCQTKFNRYNGMGHDLSEGDFYMDFSTSCQSTLPAEWTSYQPSNSLDWKISHFAGEGGALCKNNFNDGKAGCAYYFELPPIRVSESPEKTARLDFYYAYAPYPAYADSLEIEVSADCGQHWESVWKSGGLELMTHPEMTSGFLPDVDDWVHIALDLKQHPSTPLIFRFRAVNGFGNNIWIDNIRISQIQAATVENSAAPPLYFQPNPIEETAYLVLPSSVRAATLTVTDVLGRIVLKQTDIKGQTIVFNRNELPSGTYFYFITEKNRYVAKGTLILK